MNGPTLDAADARVVRWIMVTHIDPFLAAATLSNAAFHPAAATMPNVLLIGNDTPPALHPLFRALLDSAMRSGTPAAILDAIEQFGVVAGSTSPNLNTRRAEVIGHSLSDPTPATPGLLADLLGRSSWPM